MFGCISHGAIGNASTLDSAESTRYLEAEATNAKLSGSQPAEAFATSQTLAKGTPKEVAHLVIKRAIFVSAAALLLALW